MIHVYPYWDFNPGQQVDVRITSNAPEVELFVNGVSQEGGRSIMKRERCCSLPGKYLMCPAVSVLWLTMRPAEIAKQERHSFGNTDHYVLKANKTTLCADGEI